MTDESDTIERRKKTNRRFLINLGVIFAILILGGSGIVFWLSINNPAFFNSIRIFKPISPVSLPPTLLTPETELDVDVAEGAVDLTLTDKLLVIPDEVVGIEPFTEPRTLRMPRDSVTNVFVAGLDKVRFMAISPKWWPAGAGILYVTEQKPGRVLAFPDRDGDGVADEMIIVVAGLTKPHGIAFHGNGLWVATEKRVIKYLDFNGDFIPESSEFIIDNLPAGGNHVTRTIAFDEQDRIYVSVGSSCNVCDEERRAKILRFDPNGNNEEVFAEGLRNSVGITFGRDPWNQDQEVLWATDNGRDWLGDDLPPDEINVLREGKSYGYPYCYADKIPDRSFKSETKDGVSIEQFCPDTMGPVVKIQAHTAPLGLRFLDDFRIPETLRGQLAVALHGSWNRSIPVGYEVIRVSGLLPENEGSPSPSVTPLLSGFQVGDTEWGRPVDVIVGGDGAIYISDDKAGAIYRMAFTQQ